jgi:hypothetical protein
MLDSIDEAEDMVSLRSAKTGVANTLFISIKGYGRHAPRIKIAIDLPDAFTPLSKTASMRLHDLVVVGELPPHVAEQAKLFIERNRQTLLDYRHGRISTDELVERLT